MMTFCLIQAGTLTACCADFSHFCADWDIKALEDCQCRCTFQDLFEKAVWRLEDIRSKYMPMMETCHEYGLPAALTLVPFQVFCRR